MAINITDKATDDIVRKFAAARNLTLTEAVRTAVAEALQADVARMPVTALLADIHARVEAAPATGKKADKAFFDREWGL